MHISGNQSGVTWSDSEIVSPLEDRLGRGLFCSAVATLIREIPLGTGSTVFGIVGPWGGGKTSILNLVRSELMNELPATGATGTISVADFNPWAMNDSTGLLIEFYDTLLGSSESLRTPSNRESVGQLLRKCIPMVGAVPVVGQGISKTLENFLGGRNWSAEFARIDEIISEARVRILVVVDDVDRLDSDELRTLVKTIRMLGRFRNVHYLLAYDQDALTEVLKTSIGGDRERARAFLEKIVQYPLAIPPVQDQHLRKMLEEELSPHFEGKPENLQRFLGKFNDLLFHNLHTVRAVRRYCAQADLYFDLLQREVDTIDFLLITYLRLFYPPAYVQLPTWKEALTVEGSEGQTLVPPLA